MAARGKDVRDRVRRARGPFQGQRDRLVALEEHVRVGSCRWVAQKIFSRARVMKPLGFVP